MKSLKAGKNTLKPEITEGSENSPTPQITNISEHGFWIFLKGKEYFLPFEKYPWFKNATIASIISVKLSHNHHLYWPMLDVDLSTEILDEPEKYPLTYK